MSLSNLAARARCPRITNRLQPSVRCQLGDAAALLIYRAGWTHDVQGRRPTREAAMAKLFATEAAQHVVDAAVQIHGGLGVVHGHIVESLYREVRALRIYEGASEVQRMIIARQHLAGVV